MSSSNVKSFEREAFKKKLQPLAASQQISDADFSDVIYTALSKFGIDEQQFRDAFALSKGAVDRWCMQKNMPQSFVRPKIITWILEKL